MADELAWEPPDVRYRFSDGDTRVLVGELRGLRSFAVTDDGWLTGITFKQPWTPGVNRSECWRITAWESEGMRTETRPTKVTLTHDNPDLPNWKRTYTAWEMENGEGETWTARTKPTPLYEHRDNPDHHVGTCTCGLHGYLRGSLNYGTSPDRINGVVRAWGQMAIGDRGFKAQFARILALYLPRGTYDYGGDFTFSTDEPNARPPAPEVLDKVRDRYHLPIYRTLTELTDAYPTTPPPTEAPS